MALSVALYTFLSNNPKFREFGARFWTTVILQLISVALCSSILFFDILQNSLLAYESNFGLILGKIENALLYACVLIFIISWLYLCKVFYIIYGSLYHLRKKRFLKYTKLFGWFYEKFIHKPFYEQNYRQRNTFKINSFINIDSIHLQKVKNGGTILLLYQDEVDYMELISNYIVETIEDEETIDYVSTYKSPVEVCATFTNEQTPKIVKKLSIIDCFTSHYAFDDKVVKFAREGYSQKGFKFYKASSFAEIHTAANDSWYRFRRVCKAEENLYRIPHRTIYDTLSSLIRFSSEELYFLFLRHVISSEKHYGMISLIIEPNSLKEELKNDLIHMADIVIQYNAAGMTVVK